MDQAEIEMIFRESEAYLEGHFLLTSGLHSDQYVEKFRILEHPHFTERLCNELSRRFRDDDIELVVGPATGGIILSYEVAKKLRTRGIFAERESGKLKFRRGFTVQPGQRILVVEDVLATGSSVREMLRLVREVGGSVVGVGVLADRSGGKADLGVRKEALLELDMHVWKPEECPLCAGKVPITERGSRRLD